MKNRNHFDAIDAAAEREAAALAWMESELEVAQPVSRMDRLREQLRCAIERGLPDRQIWFRYPRGAALRAWFRILEQLDAGQRPMRSESIYFNTALDEVRRQVNHLNRVTRLEHLRKLDGSRTLTLPEAAKELQVPTNTVEKWRYRDGELPSCGRSVRNGKGIVLFRLSEVLDCATRKWCRTNSRSAQRAA